MSVFTLDLDETERAALEAHRIRLGCRSGAEAIRTLLLKPGPIQGIGGSFRVSEAWADEHPQIKPTPQYAPGYAEFVPIGPVRPKPGQLQKGKKT